MTLFFYSPVSAISTLGIPIRFDYICSDHKQDVMTNFTSEIPLGKLERDFNELKLRGDDFFKIELLRPARSWYQKALELNPEAGDVKQQIDECNRLLKFETKIVWIILGLIAIATMAYLLTI